MITLEDGNYEMLPYVRIEIEPANIPFRWWYEVHYWDEKEKVWVHYYTRDGGSWGLWHTWNKAAKVLSEVWYELSTHI